MYSSGRRCFNMSGNISERFYRLRRAIVWATHSTKGKNILTYVLFVCAAFVLWFFLSLDTEVQHDFDIPVELENVPDSVVVIGNVPSRLAVVAQGKGSQFLQYMWGKIPTVKIKFVDVEPENVFSMSRAKLDTRLREYFGQGVQILSVKPDSIHFEYTSSPGVKVPVRLQADIQTNLQCVVSGPIRCSADSVVIYSVEKLPRNLTSISTEKIQLSELKDTTVVTVGLQHIAGARVVPDKISVTVPVEPLISKRRHAAIEIRNLPEGVGMITFPSAVELSYLVPMSLYNEDFPFKVYVDYNTIATGTQKMKVNLSLAPETFRNIAISPDSVEFVLEKR